VHPVHQADRQPGARRRLDDAGSDSEVVDQPGAEIAAPGHVDTHLGAGDLEQVSPIGHLVGAAGIAKEAALVAKVSTRRKHLVGASAEALIAVAEAEPAVDVVPEQLQRADRSQERQVAIEHLVRRHVAGGDDVRLRVALVRVLLLEVDEDPVGDRLDDLLAVVLVDDEVRFVADDAEEDDCLGGLREVG
jgi:hypothetical protein